MTGALDGRGVRGRHEVQTDVVIVGSGPAGCAAARECARLGARVVVMEAGRRVEPAEFTPGAWSSMSDLYRHAGTSVVVGSAPIPYLQGRMVGGSSPINGAICWRLPRDVHQAWIRDDPALREALPWDVLEEVTDEVERRLNVRPTRAAIAGAKNELMAIGAERLGLEHRPIRRNVLACEGSGLCMQGCPTGRKQSVDRTILADAEADGAVVFSSCPVDQVLIRHGRAVGVRARADGGGRVDVRAPVVIVAASAVQTPALLVRSGLTDGPVGHGFQCHPGVSLAGRFPDEVRMWEGATQGHEVIGLREEGLKFEALGFGLAVLAARLEGVGAQLACGIEDMAHWADWGVAVKAQARGRVRVVRGAPVVQFSPTAGDVRQFRRGLRVLGELMFAAGAESVAPGVRGWDPVVRDPRRLSDLQHSGPRAPAAFTAAVTHMFGTCRMGAEPARNVVRPDFRHRSCAGLYIADSSVFPSAIGVNPQVPILSIATLCARRAMGLDTEGSPESSARSKPTTTRDSDMIPATQTRPAQMGGPVLAQATTLADLLEMDAEQLHQVMLQGGPLDPMALAGNQYVGVDLSLPTVASKLLWKTFRKTFHHDPDSGVVRGWNVRMQQLGIEGPELPMRDRQGVPVTFGHYRVSRASGIPFPKGWRGGHFLDYGSAGNKRRDPARLGYTPLVAVNPGSMDLLLGWEVFKVGPKFLPMPLYWALRLSGPLDRVVSPPRRPRPA